MVPISLARLPSLVHSTGRLLMRPFKLLSYISREIPHEVYRLDSYHLQFTSHASEKQGHAFLDAKLLLSPDMGKHLKG